MNETQDIKETIKKQFQKLPPVVQEAITDASVENHLRALSEKHKLHLDQWQILENEVLMTLMGMQPAEELEENIKKEVGLEDELARELANDIATQVFDPIRREMERQLSHPEAQPEETEPIEDMRAEILAKASASPISEPEEEDTLDSDKPSIQNDNLPATTATEKTETVSQEDVLSPPVEPQKKVKRAPASGEYIPGVMSTERKDVRDDPYRESPDEEE